jgi:MFS family permease
VTTAPAALIAPRARKSGWDLLRTNPDFRALFAAQIVSLGGDWFATVALLGIVGELSSTPSLAKAMVFVSQSLPAFLMTPLAGPVADRYNRKRVMLIVSAVQAVVALGFLAIGPGRVWVAYVAQGGVTALGAFFQPASQAAVANLVDPEDLPTATSTLGATWGTMLAVGASVGGLFTKAFGRRASFLADAASFVIAAGILLFIRRRTDAGGAHRTRMRPLHDTREALALARSDHQLRALLPSKAGMGLSTGVVGLLTVLAVKRFHAGDGGTGLLLAARGAGVVAGPLVAGRLGGSRDITTILRMCAYGCLGYGLFYGGVALAPVLWVAAVFTALAHIGGGAQWTLSTLGLTLATPDEFRGRILSADFALVTLSMSVSFVVGGLLGDRIGATAGLLILGSVGLVWGLFYLRLTAKLRAEIATATRT